jgi:hypothetical protein
MPVTNDIPNHRIEEIKNKLLLFQDLRKGITSDFVAHLNTLTFEEKYAVYKTLHNVNPGKDYFKQRPGVLDMSLYDFYHEYQHPVS